MILSLFFATFAFAKVDFHIHLKSGTTREKKGEALLQEFNNKYDLKPYGFTMHLVIEEKVIPHSHPILTLNTRDIKEPDQYLAVFLHEEIHWFMNAREEKLKKFIDRMKAKYPKVPSREGGGADDAISTWEHFAVCYYELQALKKYLGEKRAVEIFSNNDIYPWVRAEILKNPKFFADSLAAVRFEEIK